MVTRLDHEVIAFNILSKNAQKVNSSLNALYNVQKANCNNFFENLHLNHVFTKWKLQTLNQFLNIENMKKMTILLCWTIENAINENNSKRRLCNWSKVW